MQQVPAVKGKLEARLHWSSASVRGAMGDVDGYADVYRAESSIQDRMDEYRRAIHEVETNQ